MRMNVQKLRRLPGRTPCRARASPRSREEGASQVPEVTEFGGGYVTVLAFAGLDERKRALAITRH